MYAVIESGSKQYRVTAGQEIDVELLEVKVDSTLKLDKVLLVSDGTTIEVGTPFVKGATVSAKVVGNVKDAKVTTFKYKNKVNYHRTVGHRQNYTRLKIEKISLN